MLLDLRCDEPGSGNFETKSSVEYAKHDILSIQIHSSYFCGGAYPTNDANLSTTFDLKSGMPITFEDLFGNLDEDRKKNLLQKLYAGHLKFTARPDDGKGCEEGTYFMDELLGSSTAFYFSEKGLIIQPAYPHVIEACAFPLVIPYAKAATLAPEGSSLKRLVN